MESSHSEILLVPLSRSVLCAMSLLVFSFPLFLLRLLNRRLERQKEDLISLLEPNIERKVWTLMENLITRGKVTRVELVRKYDKCDLTCLQ